MKKTTQSINGTSFHDIIIKTTVQKLISKLGEPDYIDNTGLILDRILWTMESYENEIK